MEEGEHSLKTSGPYLIQFGSEVVLKIWRNESINQCSDEVFCRTPPATPGLLNMLLNKATLGHVYP